MNDENQTITLCRLCLSKKKALVDIFESSQIIYKIRECTNIEIVRGDGYPSVICVDCSRRLNNAFKFKKKCETSAEILKQNTIFNKYHSTETVILKSNNESLFNSENATSEIETLTAKSCKLTDYQSNIKTEDSNEMEDYITDMRSSFVDKKSDVYVGNGESNSEDGNAHGTDNLFVIKNQSSNDAYNKRKVKKIESCTECGKLYKSPGFLAHHIKVHHNGKSTTASRENFYKASLDTSNKLNKAFVCTVCGKRFTQASNLEVHHRSHTGERPFQCDICFKSFTQVNNLYVHKRVHTNFREFKCQVCPMEFKLLSHLGEHMKTHSNVKQHQCTSCGKGFHKNSHLLTHMRTHTGEKPFNCEHCVILVI
ncbi:uncharacterized protein LOC143910368 isoform X2 [Arctopsyche grandis]|uniref:uncharacterized protein LOC143910368 isoform X2 n=1 Tax=Arctopsyche grandis TaxID=121162 RepID=UPI00406D8B98